MSRPLFGPALALGLAALAIYGLYGLLDGIFRGEDPAPEDQVRALHAAGLVSADACTSLAAAEARRERTPWDEDFSLRVNLCLRPGYEGSCAGVAYALQWGTEGVTDRASAAKFAACGCSKGYPTGCNVWGTMFDHGHGVEQSRARSGDIYEWACAQDNADACVNLGVLYERGLGRPRDTAKAADLYRARCETGFVRACSAYAYLLETGQGVAKDLERALELHEAGCDEEQFSSCNSLALALENGEGLGRDVARARQLFEASCDGQYPPGCENYARLLLAEGRADEALTFLIRGCTLETTVGRRSACHRLGRELAAGKVDSRGLADLQSHCERGLLDACVGAIVAQAVGEDLSPARREVDKACELGWDLACQYIEEVTRGGVGRRHRSRRARHRPAPRPTSIAQSQQPLDTLGRERCDNPRS